MFPKQVIKYSNSLQCDSMILCVCEYKFPMTLVKKMEEVFHIINISYATLFYTGS